MEATAARDLYLSELDRIERIVRYVCRHEGGGPEVEDFSSVVKLRLIEDDFAILRKFRGRSRISTYLVTVIQRLYVDHRVRERGRWRSSAAARRLGALAVRLEELTRRDGLTVDEAYLVLTMNEAQTLTRDELTQLYAQIPTRVRGRRTLRSPRPDDATTDGTEVLDGLVSRDRDRAIARAVRVLDSAMRELDPDERLLLSRAFVQGRSMTEVSKDMQVSRHSLHRRVSRTLERLRELVEAGGLCAVKARELFALGPLEFDVPAIGRHAATDPADAEELELATR
jgi:RNA polymerase sigma factor for flagellar operon FliA